MKVIRFSIKSNLYKMYHSKLLWIHLLLPILAVVAFNVYFAGTSKTEVENVELYLQVIALLFPLMISIVTTLVYEADLGAGEFQLFRMLAAKKVNGHVGNLSALLFMGSMASLLAVAGFGLIYQGIGFLFYVKAAGILFVVNITGYIIQYVLCYTFGKGVSLGLGMIGILLGPLMYLGIGDFVWKWIPCSYGIRMISYYFISCTSAQDNHSYFIDYVTKELSMGTKTIACVTIFVSIIFYVWGNVWEGSRTNPE